MAKGVFLLCSHLGHRAIVLWEKKDWIIAKTLLAAWRVGNSTFARACRLARAAIRRRHKEGAAEARSALLWIGKSFHMLKQ